MDYYWAVLLELVRTPFAHTEAIWGIVPLYFGWVINELTSAKASFTTAIQTGFAFMWAATHWGCQYFRAPQAGKVYADAHALLPVNVLVTGLVMLMGLVALISGLRRKYPRYGSFLGHTRFSNYFMIAIFPIQANYLTWSWDRLAAIALFAAPAWFLLHFGLMPLRKGRR
jgi:hypothetical protein